MAIFIDGGSPEENVSQVPERLTFSTLRHFIAKRWSSESGLLMRSVGSLASWDLLHIGWTASSHGQSSWFKPDSRMDGAARYEGSLSCGGTARTWVTSSVPEPKKRSGPLERAAPEYIVPHLISMIEQIVHHAEATGQNQPRHRPLVELSLVAKLDTAGRLWLMYVDRMELQREPEASSPHAQQSNQTLDCNAIGEDAAASLTLQCRFPMCLSHKLNSSPNPSPL